jgi:hypothetical protein
MDIQISNTPSLDASLQALSSVEPHVREQKSSLRKSARVRIEEPVAATADARVSTNLVMSVLLLIAIVLAGTFSLRDLGDDGIKRTRQCPLTPWITRLSAKKCDDREESCDDGPVDWDRILTSSKYDVVFDPSRLKIDSLLTLPPPTFRSKTNLATETMNYLNLMHRIGNLEKYISISN